MVARPHGVAGLGDVVGAFELRQQHGGRDLVRRKRGTEIDPRVALPLAAVERAAVGPIAADDLGARREARVVHDERAGFSRHHVLGVMKAEHAEMAERARGLAAIGRHQRLCGVLDDDQLMLLGQGHDGRHVAGNAGIVDRNDRARPWRDRAGDLVRVDVERVGAHIDEDRSRAAQRDRIGAGHERERRHHHFVAGADIRQQRGEFERGGRRMREVDGGGAESSPQAMTDSGG